MKIRGRKRKWLLKEVARAWLPDEIIDRKKEGFPVPVPVWFREDLREFVRDNLSSDTIERRGLFQRAYIEQLLDQHESGLHDHSSMIYGLLCLELWQKRFMDRQNVGLDRRAAS